MSQHQQPNTCSIISRPFSIYLNDVLFPNWDVRRSMTEIKTSWRHPSVRVTEQRVTFTLHLMVWHRCVRPPPPFVSISYCQEIRPFWHVLTWWHARGHNLLFACYGFLDGLTSSRQIKDGQVRGTDCSSLCWDMRRTEQSARSLLNTSLCSPYIHVAPVDTCMQHVEILIKIWYLSLVYHIISYILILAWRVGVF